MFCVFLLKKYIPVYCILYDNSKYCLILIQLNSVFPPLNKKKIGEFAHTFNNANSYSMTIFNPPSTLRNSLNAQSTLPPGKKFLPQVPKTHHFPIPFPRHLPTSPLTLSNDKLQKKKKSQPNFATKARTHTTPTTHVVSDSFFPFFMPYQKCIFWAWYLSLGLLASRGCSRISQLAPPASLSELAPCSVVSHVARGGQDHGNESEGHLQQRCLH